jgi:hypothetical protein
VAGGQADQGAALGQPAPEGGDGQVGGHPPDPGPGLIVAADPLPLAMGAQERLLGGVLGRLPAPGHGVGEPDHPVALALIERLEPLG